MLIYLLPVVFLSLMAVLYQKNILRVGNKFYGFVLFSLALFSGSRFQIGQDWPAYKQFFDELDLNMSIFGLYNSKKLAFESGFYVLNYLIKSLRGTYEIVFLFTSFFLSYALYVFTKKYQINKFYILTIYIGYPFLLLNFAQVRQAISIGVILLACTYYLNFQKKVQTLMIAGAAVLFQQFSLIYVFLLAMVFFWPQKIRLTNYTKTIFFLGFLGLTIFVCNYYGYLPVKMQALMIAGAAILFQYYSLFYVASLSIYIAIQIVLFLLNNARLTKYSKTIIIVLLGAVLWGAVLWGANSAGVANSASIKMNVYLNHETKQSPLQIFFSFYLIFLVWYIRKYCRQLSSEQKFIVQYAILALVASIIATYTFPNNYVVYSRLMILGNILQGYAMALIFSRNEGKLHIFLFIISIVVSIIFYCRILYLYANEYIPYQSFIHAFSY